MPAVVGKNTYRLCGIDTNIISEVVKNPRTLLPGVASSARARPITSYVFLRTRCSSYVVVRTYTRSSLRYSMLTLALSSRSEEQLFEAQRSLYPDPSRVDPLLFGFSLLESP